MPPRDAKILLVLDDAELSSRLFRPAAFPPATFATTRWGLLTGREFAPGRLAGVLYQVDRHGRCRSGSLQRLRKMAPGLPILPFRIAPAGERRGRAAGRAPRGSEPAPPPLVVPLDGRVVEALLAKESSLAELRQRIRRSLGAERDQGVKLHALASIVRSTGNELDPHRIIDLAMEQVRSFLSLKAWLFLLSDPAEGTLTVARTGGEGLAASQGAKIAPGEGIAGRAAQLRQPVLVEDVGVDGSTYGAPELPQRLTARSVLAVPLLSRGRVIGVVEVIDRTRGGRFRNEDARLLLVLLEPAAVAVDNALLLRRSEELSVTDDLTKLYNSRYLNSMLRREVERSKRYRTPVSLIFLDLDGFKEVNDRHGHLCGSRTLIEVGAAIKATVREIDVVSRFGGDEFTVILPQTGPEGAQIIAERIRQRIAETIFLGSYGLGVRITASVGIASFPDHGRSKDDLIARADQAMYAVKGHGKNGVALAEPDSPRPAVVQTVR